jgi:hypothetical protein
MYEYRFKTSVTPRSAEQKAISTLTISALCTIGN